MKKKLSVWSKEVKKAMIDMDMDTNDVANKLKWSKQYTSRIINGGAYHRESVNKLSRLFGVEIPQENGTLAIVIKDKINEQYR